MSVIICPKCGKENRDGSKYCSSCGTMLDVAVSEGSTNTDEIENVDRGEQQMDLESSKQGLFRRPAGKILIIAIIAAVVVILVVAMMWHRSGRNMEQEDQEFSETVSGEEIVENIEKVEDKETEDSAVQTDAADNYILPESDTRYYTESELSDFTDSELRLARNEIYARHGRIFDSDDLRDYFESQSWYNGTIEPSDFSEGVLNEYEKANIKTIQSLENASGTAGGANSILVEIPSDQSYSCDLNGDGTAETVAVTNDNEQSEVSLLINGENCATIDWAWSGTLYVVDIDSSDGTLQIGVQYSTDDDYTGTAFYSYDSDGVHLLDYIPGSFYGEGPYPNITCTGDGTIQSYKALNVFETWFASAKWMLDDGQLVELVPAVYEPLDLFDGKGINLTVLQSISVTENDPYSGDWISLPAGTKVHMSGTDNKDWVSMIAEGYDGTMYLQLYDGYWLFPAGSEEKTMVNGVFENLSIFG